MNEISLIGLSSLFIIFIVTIFSLKSYYPTRFLGMIEYDTISDKLELIFKSKPKKESNVTNINFSFSRFVSSFITVSFILFFGFTIMPQIINQSQLAGVSPEVINMAKYSFIVIMILTCIIMISSAFKDYDLI